MTHRCVYSLSLRRYLIDRVLQPAYEATNTAASGSSTLEYGPTRPFQPAHPMPHSAPPVHHTAAVQPTGFWNGPMLTPAQTGFVPTPPPPPIRNPQQLNSYSPTTTPTQGQPLLNSNQLLVYPAGEACVKCRNTGYKQHDPSHPCRKVSTMLQALRQLSLLCPYNAT